MDKDMYSKTFLESEYADSYEKRYSGCSYDDILWEIEKQYLLEIIGNFKKNHKSIKYLDFAVGSGRIISLMENYVDSSTGIDISPAMLKIAQERVKHSELFCTDITNQEDCIENKYDCITAFRFFLNADLNLRTKVIQALARSLKDDSSILIFNNHGNLWSHKLCMWPAHKLCEQGKCYTAKTHYMSLSEAMKLAGNAGLVIDRVIGYGLLSQKARWIIPFDILLRIEARLATTTFARHFGVNQIYVARLK